jgi:hypothetical protein
MAENGPFGGKLYHMVEAGYDVTRLVYYIFLNFLGGSSVLFTQRKAILLLLQMCESFI